MSRRRKKAPRPESQLSREDVAFLRDMAEVLREDNGKPKKKPRKPKNPPRIEVPDYSQAHPQAPILGPDDGRDLSALLSYGPAYLPYTAAWTDNRIEQVHAFKRWVFVAADLIATHIANKRPNISRLTVGDPEDQRTQLGGPAAMASFSSLERSYRRAFPALPKSYSPSPAVRLRHLERLRERQRALTPLLSHESLAPVEHNHPLRSLLSDPNDPDTGWHLWYETCIHLLLTGNAYWWMPKNKAGKPVAIWVVPAHWMWPIVGKDRLIDGWEVRPVEGNYLNQVLPMDQVIHFRKPNPISKIDGFSPLTAIAQWADVSESIDRSRVISYRNGMTPTVAVQFDGTLNDPGEDMLRRIEAKFIARYYGENRSNRPIFLPPGVKVVPLTIKPNQMVWGENAEETRNNILAGYHVPPGIIAVEPTQPGDQVTFCGQALNPLAGFLSQVVSEKVCSLYDASRSLRVWWEDFVPDDPKQLESTIKTDLLCGAITTNEVRILRGRQPIPEDWADRPILPVNMAPLTLPHGGTHQDPASMPPAAELPEQPNFQPSDPSPLHSPIDPSPHA